MVMKAKPSSPLKPARHPSRNGSTKRSCVVTAPVSDRYRHHPRVSPNTLRQWAFVKLFQLSPSEIAKATGYSRCYVARLLSLNDHFQGSPEFYRALEAKLGAIIERRTSQCFTVPATPVQRVRAVLELAEAA
jgi:hypothetical protein